MRCNIHHLQLVTEQWHRIPVSDKNGLERDPFAVCGGGDHRRRWPSLQQRWGSADVVGMVMVCRTATSDRSRCSSQACTGSATTGSTTTAFPSRSQIQMMLSCSTGRAWSEERIVKVQPGLPAPMITVALAKGALLKDSVKRFAAAGLDFSAVLDKDNRQLMPTPCGRARALLVRNGDVPTYVSYGQAQLGVVGYDVLKEHQLPVAQLVDLGFRRLPHGGGRQGQQRLPVPLISLPIAASPASSPTALGLSSMPLICRWNWCI